MTSKDFLIAEIALVFAALFLLGRIAACGSIQVLAFAALPLLANAIAACGWVMMFACGTT